jgi:hypothetical protein
MKRSYWLALGLPFLTALLLAQPGEKASSRSFAQLASAIQTELESHGDRVLGQDAYHWSTRLERMEDCRAEFSVRVISKFGEASTRTETVQFSLGAIDPYGIDLQKSYLVLPCTGQENCVHSTSTCSTKNKNGIVTDCTSASPKRLPSFPLEFDGDAASASRLEKAVRQAVEGCRVPKAVTF